jgi:thioesterase domain-containing protein
MITYFDETQPGIHAMAPTFDSLSLVCMTAPDARKQAIYCVHGADGKVSYFRRFAECLADQPFYGIRAKGLDGESPYNTIEEMAKAYIAAIETIDRAGPYVLIGYSAGGVIAYEMAQKLVHSGRHVDLIILDSVEPRELCRPMSLTERVLLVPRLHPQYLREWPRHRLLSFLRNRSITPPDTVGEAYWRAQNAYEPQPYRGNLFLVRSLRAGTDYLRSGPTLGWEKLILGTIDVFTIDCMHVHIFEEPAVSRLAAAVRKRLDSSRPRHPLAI